MVILSGSETNKGWFEQVIRLRAAKGDIVTLVPFSSFRPS